MFAVPIFFWYNNNPAHLSGVISSPVNFVPVPDYPKGKSASLFCFPVFYANKPLKPLPKAASRAAFSMPFSMPIEVQYAVFYANTEGKRRDIKILDKP